jgi:hypothetical protein
MLRELKSRAGQRWFTDDQHDLYLWLDAGNRIIGFQFCYDKQTEERAVTWRDGSKLTHERVLAGDDVPTRNDSPELVPLAAEPPFARLLAEFSVVSTAIDPAIRQFVTDVLHTCTAQSAPPLAAGA